MDFETTGLLLPIEAPLDQQPHIIEIGALRLDGQYRVIDSISELVRPPIPIDEELHKKITKLTNADLADRAIFAAWRPRLIDFFHGARVVYAHNMPFDLGMLTTELRRLNAQYAFPYPHEQVCTAEWSAQRYGKRLRLTQLYEKVIGTPLEQKHRAIDDCHALLEIVRKARL
jgi:DNA polymerase III epsilon subunit-like protein